MRTAGKIALFVTTSLASVAACGGDDDNGKASGGTGGSGGGQDASVGGTGGSAAIGGSTSGGSGGTGGTSATGGANSGGYGGSVATGGSSAGGGGAGGMGGMGEGGSGSCSPGGAGGQGGAAALECVCTLLGEGGAAGAPAEVCFEFPAACGDITDYEIISGTSGDDTIEPNLGAGGRQAVIALEGADTVQSSWDDDCYLGGPGDDRLEKTSEANSDIYLGGPGNDTFAWLVRLPDSFDIVDMGNGRDKLSFNHETMAHGIGTPGTSLGLAAIELQHYNGSITPSTGVRIIYDSTDGEIYHYTGESNNLLLLGRILNHEEYEFDADDFVWE